MNEAVKAGVSFGRACATTTAWEQWEGSLCTIPIWKLEELENNSVVLMEDKFNSIIDLKKNEIQNEVER